MRAPWRRPGSLQKTFSLPALGERSFEQCRGVRRKAALENFLSPLTNYNNLN
jgi:hypothetical protein